MVASVALLVLLTPAEATQSERTFSVAGTQSKRRGGGKLKRSTLSHLTLLKRVILKRKREKKEKKGGKKEKKRGGGKKEKKKERENEKWRYTFLEYGIHGAPRNGSHWYTVYYEKKKKGRGKYTVYSRLGVCRIRIFFGLRPA